MAAGADVEARDKDDMTPLHSAALADAPAAIAALLEAGSDLEARNRFGDTPLVFGTLRDSPAAVASLLEAGADPNAHIGDGTTALHLVGAPNPNFAHSHEIQAAMAILSALLEAGADPNARNRGGFQRFCRRPLVVVVPEGGATPLHGVAGLDNPAVVRALLEAGADPGALDYVGRTAVDWAVWRRNTAMIAALAEAGADLNVPVRGRTALHQAIIWHYSEIVAALAAAGADPELRNRNGWTALQLAAYEGQPVMIAALVEAGADLEVRDHLGRTALQLAANRDNPGRWDGGPSTPAAVAALVEAGSNLNAHDSGGTTALNAAAVAGNQGATGILLALGANWTSDPDSDLAEVNARIVVVELFQGPMVWRWRTAVSQTTDGGSGEGEESSTDHARALLHRETTVAVRIGSENAEPMPELSVSLSDAAGRAWAVQADLVHAPRIVSLPSDSQSSLWETEYVYELPADWVDSGHRASLAIDPHNRLDETDENDNAATLTMDGHAAPIFDVTFVPIVFSGDPPAIDTDTYMAVIGDLLPIGDYRAQVGRLLDLSDRNLGTFDRELSRDTALSELLHRWNAEAGANEYYHGLLSSAEQSIVIGGIVFGGVAHLAGHVAVSDAISGSCHPERICQSGSR